MQLANPANYLIIAVIVIFFIGRQFMPRQLSDKQLWLLPVAATVYGLYQMTRTQPSGLIDIAMLVANVTLGAVLGLGRGLTMKVWRSAGGSLMTQGTVLTLVLWVVSFGLRFGIGFLSHSAVNMTELPIFIGVTFGMQNAAIWLRGLTTVRQTLW